MLSSIAGDRHSQVPIWSELLISWYKCGGRQRLGLDSPNRQIPILAELHGLYPMPRREFGSAWRQSPLLKGGCVLTQNGRLPKLVRRRWCFTPSAVFEGNRPCHKASLHHRQEAVKEWQDRQEESRIGCYFNERFLYNLNQRCACNFGGRSWQTFSHSRRRRPSMPRR